MLFNSYVFIFGFLPLVLAGFYATRRLWNGNLALLFVTACSIGFYSFSSRQYVPLLLISVAANYTFGSYILRSSGSRAKWLTATGVSLNLAALGYYKYANFLVDQANALGANFALARVALPLAISFYTFQQIAYLVDCRRGHIRENTVIRYIFLVTFFPHLIAGPIVRFREIAPQFRTFLEKPAATNLAVGLAVFTFGLAKKVLIADHFGIITSHWFLEAERNGHIDIAHAWIASLSYTLQLYFDFSGYCDMAIGLAKMFGFRLAVNFLSPYKSASISEFWRRWHITLSRFLMDYLYIPLGGNRKSQRRTFANLLATMTLGGLWHGAAWTFVGWGFYHGLLLVVNRAWRIYCPARAKMALNTVRPVAIGITFVSVVFGWVLFRSPDFATAEVMAEAMVGIHASPILPVSQRVLAEIAIGLLACWMLPNVYQIFHGYRPALILRGQYKMVKPYPSVVQSRLRPLEAIACSLIVILCLYVMRSSVSQFLYFMF